MLFIKIVINESFLEYVTDDIKNIIRTNIEDNPNNYPLTLAFNNMLEELKNNEIEFTNSMLSDNMLSTITDEILKGIHN